MSGSPLALARQNLLRPMLASSAAEPFNSTDHIYELKWGGVRALAFVEDGELTLIGGNGRDISDWYPEMDALPSQVAAKTAVLDGEIVPVGKGGYPDFELLRRRFQAYGMAPPPAGVAQATLCYQAYDVLEADGVSLLEQPLAERKAALAALVTPSPALQLTDYIEGEGVAFYQAAVEHRLEGIVAKRKHSEYHPGQSSEDWLEIPILQTGDFVIGGYTFGGPLPSAKRSRRRPRVEPFSTLLVGAYDADGSLAYAGNVSGPFTLAEATQILQFLTEHHSPHCPFAEPPPLREQKFIHWCRPELVCRLRFSEWLAGGILRFPYFVALRPDLLPGDCVSGREG
jgi:bifunctional non-homologous end joining protein LigD